MGYDCTALPRNHLPFKQNDVNFGVFLLFFVHHLPVNTGVNFLLSGTEKVDNDVRSFVGWVQKGNVITDYNTCTLGFKVST